MRLTVLGSYGPYPPAGGACSGYLLEQDNCRILLDCGNGVLSRLQRHCALFELQAVLLSHLHSDHISDLFILRYGLDIARGRGLKNEPLLLYAPGEPAAEFERLAYKNVFQVESLEAGRELQIGPIRLAFLPTIHALPGLAMRVASADGILVYSGDSEYFPGLAGFARGADLFLCEANYQESDMACSPVNHISAAQAGLLAAEASVKRLLLTHLLPERDSALSVKEAQKHFDAVEAAREGASYRIPADL